VSDTAVDTTPLVIDAATWDALVEHAWSDFPYEVCGLLGVESDGTIHHWTITNDERSMTYYVMNPKELLRAMRQIEDNEWEMVIYHSHTHTQAYPSETDIRLAAYPDATYAIVTLQDRDRPDIRAFRILDGEVIERPVARTDGDAVA
jgi:[CysO sulfur-carrier protein]-S-L-cysteine hydrolase